MDKKVKIIVERTYTEENRAMDGALRRFRRL